MKTIIIIALIVGLALSDLSITSNLTLSNSAGEFNFRTFIKIPVILNSAGYISLSVQAAQTLNGGSGNVDLIASGLFFPSVLDVFTPLTPTTYLGYTTENINYGLAGLAISNFSFDAQSSFVVSSYFAVTEKNAANNIVRVVLFKNLAWDLVQGSNGDLLYYTGTASNKALRSDLNSGESIILTFLTSQSVGGVSMGGVVVPVTPRTLESVVQINGWSYATATNYLVLTFGVATGTSSASASGSATLIATGTGDKQVYVSFAGDAMVNGKNTGVVVVSGSSTIDAITENAYVKSSVTGAYGASVTAHLVNVTFAPGANSILYDPSTGSGEVLKMGTNSASSFCVTLFLVLVALLAY